MKKTLLATLCSALLAACGGQKEVTVSDSGLLCADFRTEMDGKAVDIYILKNKNGMEVCLSNFGARILSIWVADRSGVMRDVTLGFDNIQDYRNRSVMGATVGRYAGRIGFGKATIDGVEYNFPINNRFHTIHGGPESFQARVWDARRKGPREVAFSLVSPDGDNGFPGNLEVTVAYRLTDDNALEIKYRGKSDKTTILNLTNHVYFNLDGDPGVKIFDYVMQIDADRYTPIDSTQLTTGELLPVEGTPMDFRSPTSVGLRIFDDYPPLKYGTGYDHSWALNHAGEMGWLQATAESPESGIILELYTDEPAVQFYAAGTLGTTTGRGGVSMGAYSAFCFEAQKFPDSVNKPHWPSTELKPGEEFKATCVYKFSVRKE